MSGRVHADRVRRKHDIHKRFYAELKGRFTLSAQPAIRVIGKVADAYSSLRANIEAGNYGPPGSYPPRRNAVSAKPIRFRTVAAQPFDARCLSWQIPGAIGGRDATVSIRTTQGRLRDIRIMAAAAGFGATADPPIGETDLLRRDGKWFLHATVEEPEMPLAEPTNGFLGVDHGNRQHRDHQYRYRSPVVG